MYKYPELLLMSEKGIRHLPVTRDGDMVGILSDRDLGRLGFSLVGDTEAFDRLRTRLSQPVSLLMTGSVVTIGQEADLIEAVELLLDEKLSAIPVVQSGTASLVGIVSYVDLLRTAAPAFADL